MTSLADHRVQRRTRTHEPPRVDSRADGHGATPGTRYSTRELQAAAAALASGRFANAATIPSALSHGLLPRRAPETRPVAPSAGDPATALLGGAPLVRVWAGSSGAGASTITLALADAADAFGARTRVIDAAAPGWSALLAATDTELGASNGWRRGLRGSTIVDRVDSSVLLAADVPAPRTSDGVDLTVLDVGWTTRELVAASPTWLATAPAQVEVLVIRPLDLSVRQGEAALAQLAGRLAGGASGERVTTPDGDNVLVVAVGARRWRDLNAAAPGPRLQAAQERGALLFAPALSMKALSSFGCAPLPRPLVRAAQRLLEHIADVTGPLAARQP